MRNWLDVMLDIAEQSADIMLAAPKNADVAERFKADPMQQPEGGAVDQGPVVRTFESCRLRPNEG